MSVGEIVVASPAPIVRRGRPKKQPTTPMELLQVALSNNAAIDVIERLAGLQEKLLTREAEIQFNEAMSAVQAELRVVAPDLFNSQTDSRYPSYSALDAVVRPVYTKYGFSISYDEADSPKPDHVRVVAIVRRGGHKETFHRDMAVQTTGIAGRSMMTLIHAEASADSYGKRYLLRDIFNVATGEGDTDGNMPGDKPINKPPAEKAGGVFTLLPERLEWIANTSLAELDKVFRSAYQEAFAVNDKAAVNKIIEAKNARRAQLRNGGAH